MNWDEVVKRIDKEKETGQVEAIDLIEGMLNDGLKRGRPEKEVLFDAGLLAFSLVDRHDYRKDIGAWEDDESEFIDFLGDLFADDSFHFHEFNELIRRLVDTDDRLFAERGEDYGMKTHAFASIREALDFLPRVREQVRKREQEREDEEKKIEREGRDGEAPSLAGNQASARRKTVGRIVKISAVVLAVLALFALINFDGLFFIMLFIVLIQTGLFYGCEGKGYVRSLEYLPAIVVAFGVISFLAVGVALFYHFGSKQEYPFPPDSPAITSKAALIRMLEEKQYDSGFFIVGVVDEENSGGANSECAVYGRTGEKASGPGELRVRLEDGVIEVVHYRRAKNRFGKFIKINWPTDGMRGSERECLKYGATVSIRGEAHGVKSNNGGINNVRISADEIYHGGVGGHKAALIRNSPGRTWYVFMAYLSKLWFVASLVCFIYYGNKLILLRKSAAGGRGGGPASGR